MLLFDQGNATVAPVWCGTRRTLGAVGLQAGTAVGQKQYRRVLRAVAAEIGTLQDGAALVRVCEWELPEPFAEQWQEADAERRAAIELAAMKAVGEVVKRFVDQDPVALRHDGRQVVLEPAAGLLAAVAMRTEPEQPDELLALVEVLAVERRDGSLAPFAAQALHAEGVSDRLDQHFHSTLALKLN